MNMAIMGFGVVGSGVAELIEKNHAGITAKSMQESLEIKYILDLRDFPDSPFCDKIIKDFNTILEDESVKIVVETMGGLHPAFEFVSSLLRAGKSVVTSNKELVACKGYELLKIAEEKNVNFLFEASVGGGIPIIRPINQCLAANEIREIAGILNGTTNYILTKMINEHVDFASALKTAQELGYAEKDPAADVDGIDACRKICILASLCFGTHVYPDNIRTEGIRDITLRDVAYAGDGGFVIKLLGAARLSDEGKLYIYVAPCFVGKHSQLAGVDDVFNAILVRGDAIGDVVFYGRGAGKFPTASAVVADVIDCAKHIGRRKFIGWQDARDGYRGELESETVSLYVRGTLAEGASSEELAKIVPVEKYLKAQDSPENEIAFITEKGIEGELVGALKNSGLFNAECVMRVTDY